jgi:dipeptidyl aminopeptidase/acylaminoacyl peptidase
MTPDQRIERNLPWLLEELGMGPPPDYRDDVVGQTAAMRQRPAWTFPERWIPMDIPARRVAVARFNWRFLALAGLLILAAVAIAMVAAGTKRVLPAPAYGPASNGLFVYESRGDVFVADPTTGDSRLIVGGSTHDTDPRFSPDGTRVVFVREEAAGLRGVIVDPDGGNLRIPEGEPCQYYCNGWSWSGDSRTILVTSTMNGRELEFWDTVTDDHTFVDLPGMMRMAAFRPPDDAQIAYIAATSTQRYSIITANRDGTGRTELASAADIGYFEYSPDGTRIAYEAYVAADEAWTVRIMRSDGTEDRLLENSGSALAQGWPRWSPDGQKLAVWRAYEDRPWILSILRPDGSLVRDIPSVEVSGNWSWSPDGTAIVYVPDEASPDLGACPLGFVTSCPSVVVEVDSGSISTLPFNPQRLTWQRVAP